MRPNNTERKNLHLVKIQLKNFRCFRNATLNLDSPAVLIEGLNGTGKTSLLEALYYTCYLRSFRTHTPRELIAFNTNNFFIKLDMYNQQLAHEIQVGFADGKRLVKVDQKTVNSYKELMNYYRIVCLTEDDIQLIKEGPAVRRNFIDQAIVLHNPEFMNTIRTLRSVLEQRNSLFRFRNFDQESYRIWTEQLWQVSYTIQKKRIQMLAQLQHELNKLAKDFFYEDINISLHYKNKKVGKIDEFDQFWAEIDSIKSEELRLGRSVFGAHLDDFSINFQKSRSKAYASRGQQKLTVLLMKIAHLKLLTTVRGPSIVLLDDFMTDFDQERVGRLLQIIRSLDSQIILTAPISQPIFVDYLQEYGLLKTVLTS